MARVPRSDQSSELHYYDTSMHFHKMKRDVDKMYEKYNNASVIFVVIKFVIHEKEFVENSIRFKFQKTLKY